MLVQLSIEYQPVRRLQQPYNKSALSGQNESQSRHWDGVRESAKLGCLFGRPSWRRHSGPMSLSDSLGTRLCAKCLGRVLASHPGSYLPGGFPAADSTNRLVTNAECVLSSSSCVLVKWTEFNSSFWKAFYQFPVFKRHYSHYHRNMSCPRNVFTVLSRNTDAV